MTMDSQMVTENSPKDKRVEPLANGNSLLDPIFWVILALIHLACSQFQLYSRFLSYQYHRFISQWEEHYLANLHSLKNLPANVAIGINSCELNCDKFAQLIKWCKSVPTIKTVTIYHPYTAGKPIAWKRMLPESSENFIVNFLPFSSGRQSLVNAARHFASDTSNSKPISQKNISAYLKNDYPNPDPEMLLIFGDCHIYNNFPCWQIRLTETVFMPPLDLVTLSQFYQALNMYSKCERRFGT